MGTPYLTEIRIMSFNFPPKGWAFCNGQTLPINQNQAVFSLMGTTYGGNGTTNFQLPNLQGRVPMHVGNGHSQGEVGGETSHFLTVAEIAHGHPVMAAATAANTTDPTGACFAASNGPTYAPPASLVPTSVVSQVAGSGQPHSNLQPYLTVSFCIALQGIFPSRN